MDCQDAWRTQARYTVFDTGYDDGAAFRVLADVWRTDPQAAASISPLTL